MITEKTILVVDDDDMNLRMVEFILSKEPYRILKASSGMEALLILQKEKIDLVLLDIEMPIMSGMQVLEVIRKDENLSNLPVIFLTALADYDDVKQALLLGVENYVVKPFIPENLLERVKKELNRYRPY